MPNLEGRLEAVVAQSEVDGSKWHTIVHGDDMTTVQTESGNVPSVAKQLKDVRAEIINAQLYRPKTETYRLSQNS